MQSLGWEEYLNAPIRVQQRWLKLTSDEREKINKKNGGSLSTSDYPKFDTPPSRL